MIKLNTANVAATTLSFYLNPYERATESWIDAVGVDEKNRPVVVLSNTVLYPQGGGQRGDHGKIVVPDAVASQHGLPNIIQIVDTRKEAGIVFHILADPSPMLLISDHLVGSEKISVELDWDFRLTQMRLHSTAHLIHCFMEKALGIELAFPKSSDLHEDHGINVYDGPDLIEQQKLDEAVHLMNSFTASSQEISTYADPAPGRPAWARLWECSMWKIPCGGVHPKNTSEIGPIRATTSSRKKQTSISFSLAN